MTSAGESAGPISRGLICYYSGSGNTKLACQYIAGRIKSVRFDLFNVFRGGTPPIDNYDILGFATFTDFLDPPQLMRLFMHSLPRQKGKPAFVFNTFGNVSGKTLWTLCRWASSKGFRLLAAHSLHVPESYPPMVAGGHGNEEHPTIGELEAFNSFIAGLEWDFEQFRHNGRSHSTRTLAGMLLGWLPLLPRTLSKNEMGAKYVDASLCDECGICRKICPYSAIELDPKPVFDLSKCYGCWSCYNHCPQKAIYTAKYRGRGHYPRPIESLKDKLKVS